VIDQNDDGRRLRDAFAAFCGQDRYRSFVREVNTTCRSKKRLLYWQELLIESFRAAHPDTDLSTYEKVAQLFRICHVHGGELRSDIVPIIYGTFEPHATYDDARRTLFPFANTAAHGGCVVEAAETAAVDYCHACREAYTTWCTAQHT